MKAGVFRGALSLALLAAWTIPASAAQKRQNTRSGESRTDPAAARPETDTACPADDRVGRAGLRAFIDPQTGQLRDPTPEEIEALSRSAREEFARAVESLEPVVLPDGTIALDLKGLFMHTMVAVRNPDGSLSILCLPDSEMAVALVTPPPRAPERVLEDR